MVPPATLPVRGPQDQHKHCRTRSFDWHSLVAHSAMTWSPRGDTVGCLEHTAFTRVTTMADSDGWHEVGLVFQARGLNPPSVPMASVGSNTASGSSRGYLQQEHIMPSRLLPGSEDPDRDLSCGSRMTAPCELPGQPAADGPAPDPGGIAPTSSQATGSTTLSGPASHGLTTSVLTAAMTAYTLGAGITATAGTRLALQWLLITVFGLHPFQAVPTGEVMHSCCSSLLPQWSVLSWGNLRACCPP